MTRGWLAVVALSAGIGGCAPCESTACVCPDGRPGAQSCDESGCSCPPLGPTSGWRRHVGGHGAQEIHAVAVTATGAIVLGGGFSGSLDLGAGSQLAAGGSDGFVAWLAPDGTPIATWILGGEGHAVVTDVAVDPSGDVAVVGWFDGTLDPGAPGNAAATEPLVSNGQHDAFVLRLRSDGSVLSRAFGGELFDSFTTVAFAGDDVIAGGAYQGRPQVGDQQLISTGGANGWALRFAPDGSLRGVIDYGSKSHNYVTRVAGDAAETRMVGVANRDGAINGELLVTSGYNDRGLLVACPPDASELDITLYGDATAEIRVTDMTPQADSSVMVGDGYGLLSFGTTSLAAELPSGFIVQREVDGQHVGVLLGPDVHPVAAAADDQGSIVAGAFTGELLGQAGDLGNDGFVVSWDGSEAEMRMRVGGWGDAYVHDVALSPTGAIVAVGAFTGEATVTGASLAVDQDAGAAADYDAFVITIPR